MAPGINNSYHTFQSLLFEFHAKRRIEQALSTCIVTPPTELTIAFSQLSKTNMGQNKKFVSKLIHQTNCNVKLKMYFIQTENLCNFGCHGNQSTLAFKQKTTATSV